MGVRMIDTNGREHVVDDRDVITKFQQGWNPVDMSDTVTIARPSTPRAGETTPATQQVSLADLLSGRAQEETGGFGFIPSPEEGEAIQAMNEEIQREREFGVPSLISLAEAYAESPLLGATGALDRGGEAGGLASSALSQLAAPALLSPFMQLRQFITGESLADRAIRRTEERERSPLAFAGVEAAGILASALATGGAGAAGATPLGASLRAGQAARTLAAGRGAGAAGQALTRGLTSQSLRQTNSLFPRLVEGAAQGLVADTQASLFRQIRDNGEISGQALVADASIGAALGLGFEGALAAGGRALRGWASRAGRTPGGRLLQENAIGEISRPTEVPSSIDEIVDTARRLSPEERPPWWARMVNKVAAPLSGGQESELDFLSTSTVQRIIPEAKDRIEDVITILDERLNFITREMNELADPSRLARNLDSFDDSFRNVDSVVATRHADDVLSSVSARLENTLESPRTRSGIGSRGKNALKRLRSAVDDARSEISVSGQTDPKSVYRSLINIEKSLSTELRAPRGDTGVRDVLETVKTEMDALTRNRNVWGRVADVRTEADDIVTSYAQQRNALLKEGRMGTMDPAGGAGLDGSGRIFTRESIDRVVNKTAKWTGNEYFSASKAFIEDTGSKAQRLAELYGSRDMSDAVAAEARRASSELSDVRDVARVYATMLDATMTETRFSGAFSAMGMGGMGAITGSLIGGVPGMLAGFAVGAASSLLTRPVASYSRIARIRASLGRIGGGPGTNVKTSFSARIGRLRKAIRNASDGRLSAYGVAGRRLVRSTYDLHGEDRDEKFRNAREEILRLSESPDSMIDRVSLAIEPLMEIEPNLADSVARTLVRAVGHLSANMPDADIDPLTGEPILPSNGEMDAFLARWDGANDPLSIIDDMLEGTLVGEKVEAVRDIYPDIYAPTVAEIVGIFAEYRDRVPYQSRIHVSTLLQVPMDSTMEGPFMMSMQVQGTQTVEQRRAVVGPRPSSREMDLPEYTLSEQQRIAGQGI